MLERVVGRHLQSGHCTNGRIGLGNECYIINDCVTRVLRTSFEEAKMALVSLAIMGCK